MNARILRGATGAATLALALTAFGGGAAQASDHGAKDRDGVRAGGSCSGRTSWELKAKTDDGRIEVEYEVDSNVSGQTWTIRVTDNGTRVLAGTRQTQGRSGSFSAEKKVTNLAGADRFVATATNAATGETCTGTVTLPA